MAHSCRGAAGAVAMFDVAKTVGLWRHPADAAGIFLQHKLKQGLRKAFTGTYILSGGYDTARAQADLAAGDGDLVAFARAFLANPDLVERMRADAPLNPPDMTTFYTPGAKGYTDYPRHT